MKLPARRQVLATAAFSLSMGLSAFAIVQAAPDPAKPQAQAPGPARKGVELTKVFPYLDKYLSLAPGERDKFLLAYYLRQNGRPPQDVKAWIQHGAAREAVPVGADGRLERLPTLAQLKGGDRIFFDVPPGAKLGVTMEPRPTAKPAVEMSAADIAGAIEQTKAAIHRFAGVFGFAAPRIDRAVFAGAGSGTAVMGDAKAVPLPETGRDPYYDPAVLKGVKTLRFAKAPTMITLAGGK